MLRSRMRRNPTQYQYRTTHLNYGRDYCPQIKWVRDYTKRMLSFAVFQCAMYTFSRVPHPNAAPVIVRMSMNTHTGFGPGEGGPGGGGPGGPDSLHWPGEHRRRIRDKYNVSHRPNSLKQPRLAVVIFTICYNYER